MRNGLVALAAAAISVPLGAAAARVCGNGTTTSFQYRVVDARYDSADPSRNSSLATIAASLGSSASPLYECVAQWPESWAGWYEGGRNIIWSDCIWNGAGSGQDKTVSFAVDWKKKLMYLSHTFACSDKKGFDGLATGFIALDFNCTAVAEDGTSYCTPKNTATGARPVLSISTKIAPAPLDAASACTDTSKRYQSWQLEKWLRQYEMPPGAANLRSDTGPSFTLRDMANNGVFSCVTSGVKNSIFEGACKSTSLAISTTTAKFLFDPKLNLLTITQHWECGNSSSFSAVGVSFVQATCDRGFNSDVFTCTYDQIWIGTEVI
ncbi:hypothetical protein B0T25DRAFT_589151 [Lasiosphaeria hispida]|uniref:Ig-like domain-containing protein n=1 Tax=Lasiosphaeria hispida TaxID=260671 RepID=A0AAJ0HKG9_9PEZI|nr:hypothetical protein B0T25DRAFT_589151 [Lasiosphaeria hispida]